jgi:hypothetical protein
MQILHAGREMLLLRCAGGQVFGAGCKTLVTTSKPRLTWKQLQTLWEAGDAAPTISALDGDVESRVCAGTTDGQLYLGKLCDSGRLRFTVQICPAAAGPIPSVALGHGTYKNSVFFVSNDAVREASTADGDRELLQLDDDRVTRIVSTTDGLLFVVYHSNDLGCFHLATRKLETIMKFDGSRRARLKDGAGLKARTTGVGAIASQGCDVIFSDFRANAIRHIGRGYALVEGLRLIGHIAECTGEMSGGSEYISPDHALRCLERAADYLGQLDDFNMKCRGRLTGSARTGSMTDDMMKGVRMNVAALKRLRQSGYNPFIDVRFVGELIDEHYFSLVTFFGGRRGVRMTQQEHGRAMVHAMRHWLSKSPAFTSVLARAGATGLRVNKMYRLAFTHTVPDWTAAVDLQLSSRRGKVVWELDLLRMAAVLGQTLGKPRVASVRSSVAAYSFQAGFSILKRRHNVADLVVDQDLQNAAQEVCALNEAIGGMLQADATANGATQSDLAGCLDAEARGSSSNDDDDDDGDDSDPDDDDDNDEEGGRVHHDLRGNSAVSAIHKRRKQSTKGRVLQIASSQETTSRIRGAAAARQHSASGLASVDAAAASNPRRNARSDAFGVTPLPADCQSEFNRQQMVGKNVALLAPDKLDQMYWLGRVVGVSATCFFAHYYEVQADGDGQDYYLDNSREPERLSYQTMLAFITLSAVSSNRYRLHEDSHSILISVVTQCKEDRKDQLRRERAKHTDIASVDKARRELEGLAYSSSQPRDRAHRRRLAVSDLS